MNKSVTRAPATVEGDRVFHENLVGIIPQLRSFARGLCGNRDLADDLAQDALTRAWAARQSFEPGTNFRAWMFMILRNQFYTTIKKNSRLVLSEPEFIERALTVEAAQQNRIDVQDVAAALQKLPAQQREALMLIGASELSYEEAAVIMECAIGTVKSRVARARAALARLVDGPEEIDVKRTPRLPATKKTAFSAAA
jgi:RNA polymerase sigma-70 factor, ECF subfamily